MKKPLGIVLLGMAIHLGSSQLLSAQDAISADQFLAEYQSATSLNQRGWFQDISADGAWLDLGFIALRKTNYPLANYFLAKASEVDEESETALAWLMYSLRRSGSATTEQLLATESLLRQRVVSMRNRSDERASAKDLLLQQKARELQNNKSDLEKNTALFNELDQDPNADEIERIKSRIAQIKSQLAVLSVQTDIGDEIAKINWPSPLSEAELMLAQVELSRRARDTRTDIGGKSEQDWASDAVKNVVEREKQTQNPFSPSGRNKVRAMARLAGAAQRQAFGFLDQNRTNPTVIERQNALNEYNQIKSEAGEAPSADMQNLLDQARATFERFEKELLNSEPKYKDIIDLRDQQLNLTDAELEKLKERLTERTFNSFSEEISKDIEIPADARNLFGGGPVSEAVIDTAWCTKIDFQCDERCSGMMLVDCEIAESSAQSACLAGETPNLDFNNAGGSGGFIGQCGPLVGTPVAVPIGPAHAVVGEQWHTDSRGGDPVAFLNPVDTNERRAIENAIEDTLDPLFDPDATCGPQPGFDVADGSSPGLDAYMDDFLDKLEGEKEELNIEEDKLWRIAEAKRRFALAGKNSSLRNDPIVQEMIEEIATNPGALADPDVGKKFAEKLIDRALNAAETNASASGNAKQEEWEKKAREINDLAKQANGIAEKFGIKSDALEKLTGYGDNAAGILDGAREGDGEKIRAGVQGLISGVPGPVGSLLKTPQARALAASVTYASDITNDSADVLGQFNKTIGSDDPAATEKLVAMSEAMQDKLTAKNYVDKVFVEPMKNFIKEEVPGGKAIMGIFDFFSGKSKPGASQSCSVPIPEEFG
ncbi:MAG: hypothetical protein AAF423_08425 [Pseudomonadota bacterium]